MSSPTHARKQALHLASMKAKLHGFLGHRLLLVAALAAFLLLFSARTLFSSSSSHASRLRGGESDGDGSCSKLPGAVAEALVHYATSNVTPQQTAAEIGVSLRVLQRRSPCNFLVFGLGHDSPMWAALNHGGRTVFLEEDASWIASVRAAHPGLESYHVTYDTRLTEADDLIALRDHPGCTAQPDLAAAAEASCRLALRGLPAVFHETEWDLIMVDAPTGWTPEAPGRMGAIYTAGMAARARRPGDGATDVFVHDVDRAVEDSFSKAFLCEAYLAEQVGRIRHFVIPSHREKPGTPFCPQN
ncbi:glucuronoxylan 4-O-methyltransferase 1-like [Hordeum vulgare subsp. vulgare]|uniref:Polysaccharide biosynthesis domain-containing protein n=1 Tax=Hordeum vulgare subsp. vulgare TaxID=112509 RepID=A0A8I6Y4S4_HORVV|nr:glucuronoxylan 4-O-methyltransferase 1-like [Hordeum vulgare subsp. vulgare]